MIDRAGREHGVDRQGQALAPLPPAETILAAFDAGEWLRAEEVARRLSVVGSRRLGVRASKGNWSGGMKAGVRLVHRLLALHREGKLAARRDAEGYVWEFRLPIEGEKVTTHWQAVRTPARRFTGARTLKPSRLAR